MSEDKTKTLQRFFHEVVTEPALTSQLFSDESGNMNSNNDALFNWWQTQGLVRCTSNATAGMNIMLAAYFLPSVTASELTSVLGINYTSVNYALGTLCRNGLLIPLTLWKAGRDRTKTAYMISEYGYNIMQSSTHRIDGLEEYTIPFNGESNRMLAKYLKKGKASTLSKTSQIIRLKASNNTVHDMLVGWSILHLMNSPAEGIVWHRDHPRNIYDGHGKISKALRPDAELRLGFNHDVIDPSWSHRIFLEEDLGKESIGTLFSKLNNYGICYGSEITKRNHSIVFSFCDWDLTDEDRSDGIRIATDESVFSKHLYRFMMNLCDSLDELELPLSFAYSLFIRQPLPDPEYAAKLPDLIYRMLNSFKRFTHDYQKTHDSFIEKIMKEKAEIIDPAERHSYAEEQYTLKQFEALQTKYAVFITIMRAASKSRLTGCNGDIRKLDTALLKSYCEACVNNQEPFQRKKYNDYSLKLMHKRKYALESILIRQLKEVFISNTRSLYDEESTHIRNFLRGMRVYSGSTMTLSNLSPFLFWKETGMDDLIRSKLSPYFGSMHEVTPGYDEENWDYDRDSYVFPSSFFDPEKIKSVAYIKELAAYHAYMTDEGQLVLFEDPAHDLSSYARIMRIAHDIRSDLKLCLVMLVNSYSDAGRIARNIHAGTGDAVYSDAAAGILRKDRFTSAFMLEDDLGGDKNAKLFFYDLKKDSQAHKPLVFRTS